MSKKKSQSMKWPKDGQYRESKSQMTTNIRKIYLTITS